MANSEIYVKKTKISEISGGKIDFQIRVRVINLWTTPDRNNVVEEGAMHMIFLDERGDSFHATLRKDLISQFKDQLEEGCAYFFEKFMVDVIGHVVEKNAMKEIEKNGKINKVMDSTLEDLEGNRIHCTLWDDFALKMQQCLDSHDPSMLVIIILQLCKLKKYLGVMGVSNSFHGSKLFLNAQFPKDECCKCGVNSGC
ncbi:hypothetical protein L195_g028143 [Trifolium pratense]|uniref:Replication protein A 70 kDa DNA-binding subunit B/D first OB fold domain-containing protein n=1 Tax=Trifolium pratense TaxID=57577 RepID=A0A2K3L150_TRIPR|nr:hypothetical protein L195_g028143 [Trifolium pratense]